VTRDLRPAANPPCRTRMRDRNPYGERTFDVVADEASARRAVVVACTSCRRPIARIVADGVGNVSVLGPVLPQNRDAAGVLTTIGEGGPSAAKRRPRAAVLDVTDPVDQPPPQLRVDLLEIRRLAAEAGATLPDGVSYEDAVAAERARHAQLMQDWEPTGTTSAAGRRRFECTCGMRSGGRRPGSRGVRAATVTQHQLNAAYRRALEAGWRGLTLDQLSLS
jgi:hypothetical protein